MKVAAIHGPISCSEYTDSYPPLRVQLYMKIVSFQVELLKKRQVVNMIRELLVIIRLWGYIRLSCLPTFSSSAENISAINSLFRIFTRLSSGVWEHDEGFLEECSSYKSLQNTANGDISLSYTPQGVLAMLASPSTASVLPFKFIYGSDHSSFSGVPPGTCARDVLRHVYTIGGGTLRECSR